MIGLTPLQSRTLDIIRRRCSAGLAPSFDEIRVELGLASNSGVKRLLDALQERGHIRRLRQRARSIEVIHDEAAVFAALPDMDAANLHQVLARTIGLLSDRDGIPETAAMLHRVADRLPRRGN